MSLELRLSLVGAGVLWVRYFRSQVTNLRQILHAIIVPWRITIHMPDYRRVLYTKKNIHDYMCTAAFFPPPNLLLKRVQQRQEKPQKESNTDICPMDLDYGRNPAARFADQVEQWSVFTNVVATNCRPYPSIKYSIGRA